MRYDYIMIPSEMSIGQMFFPMVVGKQYYIMVFNIKKGWVDIMDRASRHRSVENRYGKRPRILVRWEYVNFEYTVYGVYRVMTLMVFFWYVGVQQLFLCRYLSSRGQKKSK